MQAPGLVILTEEPSAKAALEILVPKIRGPGKSPHWLIAHQCKTELLQKVPGLMRGYATPFFANVNILVLVDSDRQNCRNLKKQLEKYALQSGLAVAPGASTQRRVYVRIVENELEAWFFGDWDAVRAAYPKVPANIPQKAKYRNPDTILNAWEELERILKKHGYFASGLRKIEAARSICQHMNPAKNRSRSFQVFRDTLHNLP